MYISFSKLSTSCTRYLYLRNSFSINCYISFSFHLFHLYLFLDYRLTYSSWNSGWRETVQAVSSVLKGSSVKVNCSEGANSSEISGDSLDKATEVLSSCGTSVSSAELTSSIKSVTSWITGPLGDAIDMVGMFASSSSISTKMFQVQIHQNSTLVHHSLKMYSNIEVRQNSRANKLLISSINSAD